MSKGSADWETDPFADDSPTQYSAEQEGRV